jgi:hypothetical protein
MWLHCFGAMAMPKNNAGDGGSSKFADDGTASHTWGAECLTHGTDAESYLNATLQINGATYTMDDERAHHVQKYLDDVRRRALGGQLFVEYKVDLTEWLGPDEGGTADAGIYFEPQQLVIVEDLKYGQGDKIFASYMVSPATATAPEVRRPNPQLALYALGFLADMALLGPCARVLLVISQPRLNHIDEFEMSVDELLAFGEQARAAVAEGNEALLLGPDSPDLQLYLNPGAKTCKWCLDKTDCKKLAAYVAEEVRCDFDTIEVDAPPVAPTDPAKLGRAMAAVDLILGWCNAVKAEVRRLLSLGEEVIGPDGKPYKFVEGKAGKREWKDEAAEQMAEQLLLARFAPEKVYKPQEVITAPKADKLFKKAQRAEWDETFAPLIHKRPGAISIALGSDPRPVYSGAADAQEFDEIDIDE